MPFSINEFKAQIKGDLARLSHFLVFIHPKGGGDGAPLQYRAKAVNLPGRSVATLENQIYGPARLFAHNQTFTDLRITFLVSPDMREKRLFERWQDVAVGKARGLNGPKEGMWDVGYYDDYVSTIEIKTFDDNGGEKFVMKVLEVYPLAVGDINLTWDRDDFAEMDVTFAYRYFTDDEEGIYDTETETSSTNTEA